RMLNPVFAFEQKLAENGSDREVLLDSQLIERFVVLELAKAWVGLEPTPYPGKSLGAYATHWCPLHLRRRLCAAMRAIQRGDPRAPLSTPTLQLGWLDPVRLAERLREWTEFGRDEMFELSSAIYRLPRCRSAREAAWEIVKSRVVQFDDPIRLAVIGAFAPEDESDRALEDLADLVLSHIKTSRKNRRPFDPLIASERWIADDWVRRARGGEEERPGPEDYLRLLTSAARFRVGLGESPVLARLAKRLPVDFFPVGKGRKLRHCEPGKLLAHPVPITWDFARSLRVSRSFRKVAPELPIESHWDFIEPGFPWVSTHASAFPELLSYWWVVNLWGWSHWSTPGDARTYEDAAFEWPRFVNHLATALSMPPGAVEDKSFRDRLIPCEAVLHLALRQDAIVHDLVVDALVVLASPKPPVDASEVRALLLTSLNDGRLPATSLIEVMKLFLNSRDAAPGRVLSLLRSLGDHSSEFREIVACVLEAAVEVGLADVTGAQRVAVLQALFDLRTAARRGVESPAARGKLEEMAQGKSRNRTLTLARELLQLPATPTEVPSSRTVSVAHDVTAALRWSSAYSGAVRKHPVVI
ncbi:MAG: hypothetical protein HY318_06680, partial [Armatimonadetes bacterium]|nr:hypothetical protein [Armatimonadota bacterium]